MTEKLPQQSPALSTRQKQFLKALAHPMAPLVLIGKEGLSPAVLATIDKELANHELLKVKIGNNSGLERHETSATIAAASDSSLVQVIGKTIVLYRPNPDKPKERRIVLPKK